MNEDILSVIEYKMPTFSKGQKRIASLICESYDKAAFMTASCLGKQAGVSESTVVRFAMELGYEGYPQMQKAMQEMVLNRLTSVQRMGVTTDRIGTQDVVSTVLHSDVEKLRQTGETVDRVVFQKAVQNILGANNIYILGARSASPLASFFGYYLQYMFDRVHIITSASAAEVLEQLINVKAGDCVVAFSFPRYSSSTVEGVTYCRSVGASVIGITNSMVSPLAEYCDNVLVAKSDMVSIVDSLVAPLSLVNALIVALSAGREEVLRNNLVFRARTHRRTHRGSVLTPWSALPWIRERSPYAYT